MVRIKILICERACEKGSFLIFLLNKKKAKNSIKQSRWRKCKFLFIIHYNHRRKFW